MLAVVYYSITSSSIFQSFVHEYWYFSPMSATYSTDSAGSSLSVDGDSENWSEVDNVRKTILEENPEDYVQWGGTFNFKIVFIYIYYV